VRAVVLGKRSRGPALTDPPARRVAAGNCYPAGTGASSGGTPVIRGPPVARRKVFGASRLRADIPLAARVSRQLDLAGREIRVRGKAGRERIVKISYRAARSVDRYLRVRAKHALASRPELWLGMNGRGR
jgi:hypothetical protein